MSGSTPACGSTSASSRTRPAATASTGRVPAAELLDQVHGELLPGCWDSWLVFERERLRVELIHLYEEIGRDALTRGDDHTAVLAGIASVACDPLRESSNALLISGYLAGANRPDAVRAFNRFETLLDAELGISPGVDLRRLVTSVAPSSRYRRLDTAVTRRAVASAHGFGRARPIARPRRGRDVLRRRHGRRTGAGSATICASASSSATI